MKEPGVLGNKTASILAIILIGFILVTMGGPLPETFKDFTNGIRGYFAPGFELEDQVGAYSPDPESFTLPAIPGYTPKKNELTPVLRTLLQPGFSLSSNYKTSDFYQGGTGYVKINVTNEGRNPIFIDKYGVSANASRTQVFSKDCGVLIRPDEEKTLGVIPIQIPEEKKATFNIVLWLLASSSEGKWHQYEPYYLNGFSADLKPMPEKINQEYSYNPESYFEIINQLVKPAEPDVRNKAAEVARAYPGAYNIYQVCALFDTVKEEVDYVSDPRGNDIWEPADVTLKIGAGDCEDQAILLSSMLEAVGGTTRVYLTDRHAFAAVYIGNSADEVEAAIRGIRAYYGNVDVNYLTDRYGYWLMLDPTSSLYAGGLPGQTAQAKIKPAGENKTLRSWTFADTGKVEIIDINPRKDN